MKPPIQLSRLHRQPLYKDQLRRFELPTERIKAALRKYQVFIAFYSICIIAAAVTSTMDANTVSKQRLNIINKLQSNALKQDKILHDQTLTIQQKDAQNAAIKAENDKLKADLKSKADEAARIAAIRAPTGGYGGMAVGPISFGNSYDYGQCTWFVASRVHVPNTLGNANTWDDRATGYGYQVSYIPRVGSVAQSDAGYYGHVGIVSAIDGGMVQLAEMNVYGIGLEDYRWVNVGDYRYIYF